jgi:hypothetical protein
MSFGDSLSVKLLVVGMMGLNLTKPVCAEMLISAEESRRPPDMARGRDIFRGPTIRVISPSVNAGTTTSPFHLQLTFLGHAGFQIDLDSLAVTYKKLQPVNLTERVRPFASPNGIDMPIADDPPGDHTFVVDVSDTAGRKGELTFSISVAQ